ncbi:hypothetical protein Tco_0756745 [Tanacetum coccineum]
MTASKAATGANESQSQYPLPEHNPFAKVSGENDEVLPALLLSLQIKAIASLCFSVQTILTVSANIHFQDLLQVVVRVCAGLDDFQNLSYTGVLLSIGIRNLEVD